MSRIETSTRKGAHALHGQSRCLCCDIDPPSRIKALTTLRRAGVRIAAEAAPMGLSNLDMVDPQHLPLAHVVGSGALPCSSLIYTRAPSHQIGWKTRTPPISVSAFHGAPTQPARVLPSTTPTLGLAHSDVTDMLRTALQAGVSCLPRRAASGGAVSSAQAGRRALSSLQEALVKVTFIDAEVRLCLLSVVSLSRSSWLGCGICVYAPCRGSWIR